MLPGTLVLVSRFCIRSPSQRRWYAAAGSGSGSPLAKFEKWLETKYPKVYKVHRTVVDGGKHCFADMKMYAYVRSQMNRGKPLQEFTRQELEVYVLTPNDIEKLAMIAIVIALPMTIFLMAIALAFFPRFLLTRHFWTLDQTERFRSIVLEKRRHHHFGKIAESLALEIQKGAEGKSVLAVEFLTALGNPPVTLRQLEKYSDLIQKVNIDTLNPVYKLHLSRVHGLWTWGKHGQARLNQHARILAALDSKLRSENVDEMSLPDLKQSLFIRQFDVLTLDDNEERQVLKEWLRLTARDSSSNSIILHAPVIAQLHLEKKPKLH